MKTLVAYFSHAGQNYVNGGVAELEHGNAEVLAGLAVPGGVQGVRQGVDGRA